MAVKRARRNTGEIFSVSFLDIICCAFGAMVLLILLSNTDELSGALATERVRGALQNIAAAQSARDDAESKRAQLQAERARLEEQLRELVRARGGGMPELQTQLAERRARADALRREIESLSRADAAVKKVEVVNVGGIAVDSEHIVFIVDTSGSMRRIWRRVMRELENVLDIHPQVKGFQIMDTNGRHLWSGYAGKWIADTPSRRKSALKMMAIWNSGAASTPLQGIRTALRTYAGRTESLALYVFGDDYASGGYDRAVRDIAEWNRDRKTGKPRARIHAIGFLPKDGSVNAGRFATLMREVARQNRGAYVGLALEQRASISAGGFQRGD